MLRARAWAKIASRKKFKNAWGCIFFDSSQSRIASSENGFAYDKWASGETIYAYVGGNPLSYFDPLGLKLNIGSGLGPTINDMRRDSVIFDNMMSYMDKDSSTYTVQYGSLPPDTPAETVCLPGMGCVTTIDPSQMPKFDYADKNGDRHCISDERYIAHEISHAFLHALEGWPREMFVPHNFIVNQENNIMNQIDPSQPDRNTSPPITIYRKKN